MGSSHQSLSSATRYQVLPWPRERQSHSQEHFLNLKILFPNLFKNSIPIYFDEFAQCHKTMEKQESGYNMHEITGFFPGCHHPCNLRLWLDSLRRFKGWNPHRNNIQSDCQCDTHGNHSFWPKKIRSENLLTGKIDILSKTPKTEFIFATWINGLR